VRDKRRVVRAQEAQRGVRLTGDSPAIHQCFRDGQERSQMETKSDRDRKRIREGRVAYWGEMILRPRQRSHLSKKGRKKNEKGMEWRDLCRDSLRRFKTRRICGAGMLVRERKKIRKKRGRDGTEELFLGL